MNLGSGFHYGRRSICFIMILFAVLLWSTIEVFSKLAGEATPLQIAFVRFSLASLFLLPYGLHKRNRDVKLAPLLPGLSISAFAGVTLAFLIFHTSLLYVPAAAAATVLSAVPVFIIPTSFLLVGDRPAKNVVLGVGVGCVGILLLLLGEVKSGGSLTGMLMVLVAALLFSVFTVSVKYYGGIIGSEAATGISLSLGSLFLLPMAMVEGLGGLGDISTSAWMLLLYLGFFATGLGYLLYFVGLQEVDTSRGTSLFFVKPVASLVLAIFLLGEELHFLAVVGIVIVVVSIWITIPK